VNGAVVVDASVAVQWVIDDPHTAETIALLTEWERQQVRRLVPCWFAAEVAGALYKRTRRGDLTLAEAHRALADVLAAVTLQHDDCTTTARAMAIAMLLGQSRPYDAQYAALAEREGCELWTADERFYHSAHAAFPFVHWIGEVGSTTSTADGV